MKLKALLKLINFDFHSLGVSILWFVRERELFHYLSEFIVKLRLEYNIPSIYDTMFYQNVEPLYIGWIMSHTE